jgi:glutamate racemase
MHLLITDSGVGGLSVCAFVERHLRTHTLDEDFRLTYVNASPENDFGYNSMGSRREQLENFDRFLHIVADEYNPDQIFVACNTLSVIMEDTRFFHSANIPIRGIVEVGVARLLRDLEARPHSAAMIFGTVTTISAGTYHDMLRAAGISEARIVSQACPDLADVISEDRGGSEAQDLIGLFVRQALATMETPASSVLAYLACTHYGYRKKLFSQSFEEVAVNAEILNPNELVVDDLFAADGEAGLDPGEENEIQVEFVTHYRIPDTALETISFFLRDISPATVRAFLDYTYAPELF